MASKVSHINDPSARLKALCEYGSQVEVDNTLPTKLYFRSGRELIRMANVYLDEANYESAFILYSKYITLFVERLPSHPGYKSSPPPDLAEIKKKMKTVFPLAEEIKSKLKKRYIEEQREREELEAKRQAKVEAENARKRAEEEERLREKLAEEEKIRNESEEKWCREQEERYRELQLQEQRRLAQLEIDKDKDNNISGLNNERISVPSGNLDFIPNDLSNYMPPTDIGITTIPPVPDRDLKKNLTISDSSSPQIPVVNRDSKPNFDHFTSIGNFGGGSCNIRKVVVPTSIFSQFLKVAESNTNRNTETLGILFGKLSKNAFHISDVFIPKQHGTPDSCDMENEIDLIDYQDKYDLITLGWIHTHPTQTAFLSSVDMHTHFPYQKMMPESVAIVCSPKFKESGVFRLTQNGLNQIGSCKQTGFHYHQKEPPLFEQGEGVELVEGTSVRFTDGRK
ncbi:hypothetical protein SNE40_019583 [Patella caerulea]|uniref:MPN domain-containing protein n=1 Tax=Patella caerulea TaxID=87958 RepID=A0AAN8J8R8_PATCE